MQFEWEKISRSFPGSSGGYATYRAYVPGGWLIKNVTWQDGDHYQDSGTQSESMCFVPEQSRFWNIEGVV